MKAQDCIDGQLYDLPAGLYRKACKKAYCEGWNPTHQWLLFLIIDEYNNRVIRAIMPDVEVQPS